MNSEYGDPWCMVARILLKVNVMGGKKEAPHDGGAQSAENHPSQEPATCSFFS